ncbi:MAG TPA: hypothetical protein PLH57_04950 [Oligoflexia bacterium]|nr:hypothetical protein [Oligoflexia bacterium]
MFLLLFWCVLPQAHADESMMAAPVDREDRMVEVNETSTDAQRNAKSGLGETGNADAVRPDSQIPRKRMVRRVFIRRRFYTTPSIGISSIQYKETGVSNYSAIALTGKISTRYPIRARWDVGGSMYFTLMPLTQNPSTNSARFLGVNGRIGYAPPGIKRPWRLSLLTGFYYTRMFVSNNAFGFKDMVGPQLFPVLHRSFKNGDSGMIYGKYSPVTNNLSVLSLSNRELATGITYAYLMKNKRALAISLDIALLAIDIDRVKTATSSITLGVGINL